MSTGRAVEGWNGHISTPVEWRLQVAQTDRRTQRPVLKASAGSVVDCVQSADSSRGKACFPRVLVTVTDVESGQARVLVQTLSLITYVFGLWSLQL